jgi:signal transduction histidine kinase
VPRWLPFAIIVAVAVLAWFATFLDLLVAAVYIAGGLAAAVAAVGASAYRVRRDPALLFVAMAGACIAIVFAATALANAWVLDRSVDDVSVDITRWQQALAVWFALALLYACLASLGTAPWRDRRGRPPLQAWVPVIAIPGSLVICLALTSWVLPRPPDGLSPFILSSGAVALIKAIDVAAMIIGGVACARALTARANAGLLRWVGPANVAFALAAMANLILTGRVAAGEMRPYEGFAMPASILILGTTFLLVGLLASNLQESSRLRRASDRAAEVMEGRAEIAATIAHDVRGPVGTIKGLATTTRKSYDRLGDPERLEFIGMIEQESGRLLRLVDQVAMALKIDAGSLDLHRRTQEVEPLLRQALAQVETGGRGVAIESDDTVEAPLDTRWFAEAVAQGIDNALRFSPAHTDVTVVATTDGDDVVVDITDRGPGIPLEQREVLFEKFSRWRPTGYDDRTGTGLGLFICRGIARTHGGDALLVDGPEGGTMLRIRVPGEEERGA